MEVDRAQSIDQEKLILQATGHNSQQGHHQLSGKKVMKISHFNQTQLRHWSTDILRDC